MYLNDYAEFNSKISYIMFWHDFLLACEISTENKDPRFKLQWNTRCLLLRCYYELWV